MSWMTLLKINTRLGYLFRVPEQFLPFSLKFFPIFKQFFTIC